MKLFYKISFPLLLSLISIITQCNNGVVHIEPPAHYSSIVSADNCVSLQPNQSRKLIDVKFIGQEPDYPCGCEGISALMLLDYHGFKIEPERFFNEVLDVFPFTYDNRSGTYYGEDMDRYYVGDPRSVLGKGCYAPVIKTAIEKIVTDDYIVVVEQGGTVAELAERYINKLNQPILIWATSGMRSSYAGTTWKIARSGSNFTFPAYMHCLVLVGYDTEKRVYYFNDPYKNNGLVAYDMELTEKRFKELGSQGLAIMRRNEYKAEANTVGYEKAYALRNAESGKYITVHSSGNVIQSTFKNDATQLFKLSRNDDGSVSIINIPTGKVLEAENTNIRISTRNSGLTQRFDIKVSDSGFVSIRLYSSPESAVSVCGNYNGDHQTTDTAAGNVYLRSIKESSLYEQWELVEI